MANNDYLPPDLAALPTAPWAERPEELPLDTEECRTALWMCRGNISKASELIKVPSARLRRFIAGSEYLQRELAESAEILKDVAEENIYDALTDDKDSGRRDSMTRWFLERRGKDRGYGTSSGINISGKRGTIKVSWDVDPGQGEEAKVIDVIPNRAS